MTYEQTLEYIHSTLRFGSKPGLSRIRALVEALGNPQKSLRFVHITGTNGKGSTTMMVANALREAGYKVGVYISPYVDDFRERIQVDGQMIPKEDLAAQLERLLPCIEAIKEAGHTHPTEFEIITALALSYYRDTNCDIVALEVGMGGRMDCTNIIDAPEVAVLTPISLDHTKILGDTVAAIAADKCGIIKPGCSAVSCYGQPPESLAVIQKDCARKGVTLDIPVEEEAEILQQGITGSRLRYRGLELGISMPGIHQRQNALTALTVLRALQTRGWRIEDTHIARGIENTRFGGRMEIVRRCPLSILDGGHNAGAIDVLCRNLDAYLADRRLITVMGMFQDKDTDYCIPQIARRSHIFVATQAPYSRALPAREAARAAAGHCGNVLWNEDIQTAVKIALSFAETRDVILVCGSLYLLHDARLVLARE